MSKIRITVISDTHTKHKVLNTILPGGDIIIHAGDLSSRGYPHEVEDFCKWFDGLKTYKHKVFIAGNHDFLFENRHDDAAKIVNRFENIRYLQDFHTTVEIDGETPIKIYGSPWQPEFYNWAFNLPRMGTELELTWNAIPEDTDILITHGPPFGVLDQVQGRLDELGCELLIQRIQKIKPKIHVFGHIHSGYGHHFNGHTHFFNASALGESYYYEYEPKTFDWDPVKNTVTFVKNNKS